MKNLNYIFVFLLLVLLQLSCEERYIPNLPKQASEIVVEGYIEGGEFGLPPYVLLTRSLPFFSALSIDQLDELFVHDALVTVSNGQESSQLEEICWNDFNMEQQRLLLEVLQSLGVVADSVPFNFCVYLDPSFALTGEIGRTYDLRIEVDSQVLTAQTTIPPHVPLDSLFFMPPPGDLPDDIRELRATLTDPDSLMSFYRYFTAIGQEPFNAPFNSVADDLLFDGQSFEFPLPKGEPAFNSTPDDAFGLYTLGDTATIKWCTLDEAHFNFWNTLDFNLVNQGPFGSYTRIESNVDGGLGIWGGYAVSYYSLIVSD